MSIERETRFELAKWLVNRAKAARFNLGASGIPGRTLGEFQPGKDTYVGDAAFDGDEGLRGIIAERYKRGIENVALTASASEANFLVFYAFLKGGGSVLVERPSYEPLMRLGEFLGANVKWLDRRFDEGYGIDLESLKRLVKGAKLVVLTNLHNPTGVAIVPERMKAVAEIAGDAGAYVLCDEIFRDFAPDLTRSAVDCGENCIVTCSLSKFYGFGGLRMGWTVSSSDITKRIQLVKEMGSVCCSRIDEAVAKRVLIDGRLVDEAMSIASKNKSIVKGWVERTGGVEWVEPDGGILCFPRLKGVRDTYRFAEHLFDKYGTLVSPSKYFGVEGHIRICYSSGPEILEGGFEAIDAALRTFKG
jgi:aspartate/methionine/tyrosine aminotransferase